jgi:hypothetical protein
MAHFACINKDGFVVSMKAISDKHQNRGHEYITQDMEYPCPLSGRWIQCSYNTKKGKHKFGNTPFRKNFPQVGWSYNATLDAFVPPKPTDTPSWVIDAETGYWIPPVPKPETGYYGWNESTLSWETLDPGPSPYVGWVIDSKTGRWTAPFLPPELPTYENGFKPYTWSNDTQNWYLPDNWEVLQAQALSAYEARRAFDLKGLAPVPHRFDSQHIDSGYLITLHPDLSSKLVSAYN